MLFFHHYYLLDQNVLSTPPYHSGDICSRCRTGNRSDKSCSITRAGDIISVNYRGTLPNGEEFDSSYNRQPIQFQLGNAKVIQGWDQGLMDMCIGEKRKLTIPGSLAYGNNRGVGSCQSDCILRKTTYLPLSAASAPSPSHPNSMSEESNQGQEAEMEEEKVLPRQNVLDHVILGTAGLLVIISGTVLFLQAKAKRAGKGIIESNQYKMAGWFTACAH
ncbi:Peptidyl-prolyl cis-trans isomerase [Hyphodiscus hymeniophilus]|uniref:peptidylprolyl isomerase n=1 Tax=Hyphodiscus hymeniophilus TaxID=353542 RepID=A0A9P7AVX0_9HELO|nr:Peptidyl-prolyl cis-trans isomerase [Hyphodiscus hymeniophilus]